MNNKVLATQNTVPWPGTEVYEAQKQSKSDDEKAQSFTNKNIPWKM